LLENNGLYCFGNQCRVINLNDPIILLQADEGLKKYIKGIVGSRDADIFIQLPYQDEVIKGHA